MIKLACSCLLLLAPSLVFAAAEPAELEPVTVTANRLGEPLAESVFSISRIDGDVVELVGAAHPNEIFSRVPGVWISRGSGQEHLTAIRSPVLTGAGACGAFLYLEDGIPVRPAGFCNVNQLFEINTEQADAIEVLRGPGSVLYGSNALHGVINILHALPEESSTQASFSAGEYGYRRSKFDHAAVNGERGWRAKYLGETADSIQVDAGHEQHKLNLGWYGDAWRTHVAATSLDQDTAGYILGEEAYRDPQLKHGNPNPEAFRKVESLRTWAVWEPQLDGAWHAEFRPYARYSDMDFRQHFLPGKPLEENGQTSAGLVSSFAFDNETFDWRFGTDLEWADGWLQETQEGLAEGSAEAQETRPAGKHYDYAVTQYAVSSWANLEYRMSNATALIAGARVDWIRYDYDNRMRAGNTRDDGSECGFGGCIYNRPADRTDEFTAVSPKFGIRHTLADHVIYANLLRGFRVPQATELYRLQRGQDVADLDPVRLDSFETGLRNRSNLLTYDIALFVMEKRNVIFRDAEGFNVSSGRTRHRGVEFDVGLQLDPEWYLALRGTLARHEYAFDYTPANGENFVSGRDIDTAPRTLGTVLARWLPVAGTVLELEYQHTGAYYLDAENTERYPGHGLWHVRWGQELGDFDLRLRVNNLLDEEYAERADYAFGNFRYFPGWPRRVVAELAFRF